MLMTEQHVNQSGTGSLNPSYSPLPLPAGEHSCRSWVQTLWDPLNWPASGEGGAPPLETPEKTQQLDVGD